MEETEYAFLRSRGLRVVLNDGKGIIGFPRLTASIEIERPLQFQDSVNVSLSLTAVDGKQVVYDFEIWRDGLMAASGRFEVACCRFPAGENPYAILTPDFVLEKLTKDFGKNNE